LQPLKGKDETNPKIRTTFGTDFAYSLHNKWSNGKYLQGFFPGSQAGEVLCIPRASDTQCFGTPL
jgi:hypothetical protein